MAVTPASLKALFTEFAPQDDERVQAFIDMAERRVSEAVFGTLYDDAVAFLTGHLLTKSVQAGSAGGALVSSQTIGSMSRTFVQHGGVVATGYATTAYGAEFLKLRRARTPSPMVI